MLSQLRSLRSTVRSIRSPPPQNNRPASTSLLNGRDWNDYPSHSSHNGGSIGIHRNSHRIPCNHLRYLSALSDDDTRQAPSTCAALPRQHPPSTILPTLEGLYSHLLTRVPKGFENFLPKNARTGGGDDDDDTPQDTKKKEAKQKSSDNSSNNSSGGNNNKKRRDEERRRKKQEEEMQQQLAGATLLLIAVMMARSFLEDENGVSGDGPEVTWADFYNYMLTEGDVERIVVVNQKNCEGLFTARCEGGTGCFLGQ